MTNFIFRKATRSDLDELANLAHELNLFHDDATKPDPKQLEKDWDYFDIYVVTEHEKILGYLSGFSYYQFHAAIKGYKIQNIHVTESSRRKHIGNILMKNVISLKCAEGIRRFSLDVDPENYIAVSFYESLGFEKRPNTHLTYGLRDENLEKFMSDLD